MPPWAACDTAMRHVFDERNSDGPSVGFAWDGRCNWMETE